MLTKTMCSLLGAMSILALPMASVAYDVTLEWTQNPSNEQITGYVVCHKQYQSTSAFQEERIPLSSNRFTIPADKPNRIRYTFSNLTNGLYYDFSIKAYRVDAGVTHESDYALSVNNFNHPPLIHSLSANPETIRDDQTATLSVSATDPDNDPLTYTWMVEPNTPIAGNGPQVSFDPPEVSVQTQYTFTVVVSDNHGNTAQRFVTVTVLPAETPVPPEGQHPWKAISSSYPNNSFGHIFSFANTGYEFSARQNGVVTDICGNFFGSTEVVLWKNARVENGQRKADVMVLVILDATDNSGYAWRCEPLAQPIPIVSDTRYAITMHAKSGVALKQTSGVDFTLQSGDITIHYPLIGEINKNPTDYPEYNTSIMTGQVDIRFAAAGSINRPCVITDMHAQPSTLYHDQTAHISASVHDPDNDNLQYDFSISPDCHPLGCSLVADENTAIFNPHPVDQDTVYAIQLVSHDSHGGTCNASIDIMVLAPEPEPPTPPSQEQKPWQSISDQYPHHEGGHRFSSVNMGYEFTAHKDGRITQVGANFFGKTEIVLWKNIETNDYEREGEPICTISLDASENSDYLWNYVTLPAPVEIKAGRRYAVTMHASYDVVLMLTPDTVFESRSGDITIHFPLIGEVDRDPDDYPEYNTSTMTGQADIVFVTN